MKTPTLLAVLVLLLLAGCTAPEPPKEHDDATMEEVATGTLQVTVMTPDLRPIEGATVRVGDLVGQSDATGTARFDAVPAGEATVLAEKPGYREARARSRITAGVEAETTLKLLPQAGAGSASNDQEMAGDGTKAAPTPAPAEPVPYNETFHLRGFFDCSATYLIITGDCMLIFDYALDEVAANGGPDAPVRPGDQTKEEFVLEFPLDLDWESVVAEMIWDPSTTAGQKMTFAVEPAEAPEDGHAAKYARTGGGSPLWLRLDRGVPHESASTSADGEVPDMPNPDGGEVLRTRSYVMGEAHNPGGTTFLGVGAHLQQEFDVYVTVFYLEPAPERYSIQG